MQSPLGIAKRRPFTLATAVLLLMAIVGQLVQKQCASRSMQLQARAVLAGGHAEECRPECERVRAVAFRWQVLHVASAAFAVLTWGIAIRRCERHWRLAVFGAFVFYAFLQLLVV